MRNALFSICLILSISAKSQNPKITVGGKNNVHYKSDLISECLIQNYAEFSDSEKVIYDKPLGVDVNIYVDTIFKRYVVMFKDVDGNSKMMIYTYISDYYPANKNDNPSDNKLYLMKFQDSYFYLIDFMDMFVRELEIRHNRKFPNNCALLYRIRDVRKMPF